MSAKRKASDIEAIISVTGYGTHAYTPAQLDFSAVYQAVECVGKNVALLRKLPAKPARDPILRKVMLQDRLVRHMCAKKKLPEESIEECIERIIIEARDVR